MSSRPHNGPPALPVTHLNPGPVGREAHGSRPSTQRVKSCTTSTRIRQRGRRGLRLAASPRVRALPACLHFQIPLTGAATTQQQRPEASAMEDTGPTRQQGPAQDSAPLLEQQGECRGLSSAPARPQGVGRGRARAQRRCLPSLAPCRGRRSYQQQHGPGGRGQQQQRAGQRLEGRLDLLAARPQAAARAVRGWQRGAAFTASQRRGQHSGAGGGWRRRWRGCRRRRAQRPAARAASGSSFQQQQWRRWQQRGRD